VYDSGKDEDGQLYYVMEFMPQTLKEFLLEHGPLSVEHAVAIVGQICDALAEAHSLPEPVVHRDLKPANIFIEKRQGREVVKIGDFGIAKVLDEHTTVLTHTGQASPGTPRYMAPEQWLGKPVDGRTDLYSLGIMLYEMLNGQPPFAGSIPVLMGQHLQLPPPPLPEAIPVGIRKEIEQLVAKTCEERPADAVRVRKSLEAALSAALSEEQNMVLFPRRESPVVGEQEKKIVRVVEKEKVDSLEPVLAEKSRRKRIPWKILRPLFFVPPSTLTLALSVILMVILSFDFYIQEKTKRLVQEMLSVPAGEFFMGCNEKVDEQCSDDEKPGRTVYLDAFKIDKTEVTVTKYDQCVKAGKCSALGTCNWRQRREENHPIDCVDWKQAVAFCRWDGNKRLPTEAEWEKAARGTDGRVYLWGNMWDPKRANADEIDDGFKYTAPVGSFPADVSPYGAFDMAGNVSEWTQDWYGKKYYQNALAKNPRGPERGEWKVLRGGSWLSPARDVRVATRRRSEPGGGYDYIGFRCAQ
jgi:serine/threonine-protein kinase